jgi:hypothetical protein
VANSSEDVAMVVKKEQNSAVIVHKSLNCLQACDFTVRVQDIHPPAAHFANLGHHSPKGFLPSLRCQACAEPALPWINTTLQLHHCIEQATVE